jgi:hypothetical protein
MFFTSFEYFVASLDNGVFYESTKLTSNRMTDTHLFFAKHFRWVRDSIRTVWPHVHTN